MSESDLFENPVFFENTRVWRCYKGGKLLDEFIGLGKGADTYFPEDWIASATLADNGEQQQSEHEGLSRIRGENIFFADLLKKYPQQMLGDNSDGELGVLCKFLDSAMRLPIQCHPDREFSRKYFDCNYGKTECWLILDTRIIDGEKPYVLLGFKLGATEEKFRKAVEQQDVAEMCNCLNKIEVKPGEVYFIPGRLAHAIGPGLMLLEVQEASDLVIQPEMKIGDISLSEKQMWGGLDHDTGFSCFNYENALPDKLLDMLKIKPEVQWQNNNARMESVINSKHTDCFHVDKFILNENSEVRIDSGNSWYFAIVTSGSGQVIAKTAQKFNRGDRFFVSQNINNLSFKSDKDTSVEIYMVSAK